MSKLTAESFWEKARGAGLLSEGDFIVAAVSGGADSSALLHLLWSLREEKKLTLLCAHVNHNLRGKESERDENFVRELCEKYGIPIKVLSADVSGFAFPIFYTITGGLHIIMVETIVYLIYKTGYFNSIVSTHIFLPSFNR